MTDPALRLAIANLHDAYLNASLQKRWMDASPIEEDPHRFLISDRMRFERAWVTFLYVLVEAWEAQSADTARRYVASVTPTDELDELLAKGHSDGSVAAMRETRHYMCHRDRREYWDEGRTAPLGRLEYHTRLHAAFSSVLLPAMRSLRPDAPGERC